MHSRLPLRVDAVEKVENRTALQISRKTVFACRRFCKRLSDTYEALWSPSCDSTWSLTSARAACTGGAEKFGSPARKTFFDSIGQNEPCHSLRRHGRSTSISGPAGLAVGTSGSGHLHPWPASRLMAAYPRIAAAVGASALTAESGPARHQSMPTGMRLTRQQ